MTAVRATAPAAGAGEAPIRVLVVDDSAVIRGLLGRAIDATPDLRVATTAIHGQDALDALRHTPVDVVLLDIEMPVMDGLTALPLISERFPRVRVIVASSLTREGAAITMRALALGAVDYVHKPVARNGPGAADAMLADAIAKIRAVGRGVSARVAPGPFAGRPAVPVRASGVAPPRVVAIAASTGGPNAIASVVSALPRDFALPVFVTQHMPPIFTSLFAQRLAREGALPCNEAQDGDPVVPGRVYVAPGDRHLTVCGTAAEPFVRLTRDPPEHHCRPAADPMFRSLARMYGAGVLAVVLTGMGDDGGGGALQVARAGGRVIVQDEASSVVWGMPGSVVDAGVPCAVLPLPHIAAHVAALCSPRA